MKLRNLRLLVVGAVAALTVALVPVGTSADTSSNPNLECTGTQSYGSFNNIYVPYGETCTLLGYVYANNFSVDGTAYIGSGYSYTRVYLSKNASVGKSGTGSLEIRSSGRLTTSGNFGLYPGGSLTIDSGGGLRVYGNATCEGSYSNSGYVYLYGHNDGC